MAARPSPRVTFSGNAESVAAFLSTLSVRLRSQIAVVESTGSLVADSHILAIRTAEQSAWVRDNMGGNGRYGHHRDQANSSERAPD
jgi:hypothetical protein